MGKPMWRQVFDRVERAVGAPLENAVSHDRFGDAVAFWVKGPQSVQRAVRRRVDDQLAGVLHALNIPTRDDLTRVSRQLAVLTGEVRALSVPADHIANFVDELQERRAVEAAAPGQLTAGEVDGA
ncbi:MAG: hypothetical protein ACT4P1_08310 [Sporichthyaceae bacterium]